MNLIKGFLSIADWSYFSSRLTKLFDIVKKYIIAIVIISCFSILKIHSQLGFCPGNSGDPIFTETFGFGAVNNPLPAGTTTYTYSTNYPIDGAYTISNGTFGNTFDWHQIEDHTIGDTNGKCLIVNADASPGEFYRTEITGLCENTTYEFSAWLINLVIANSFCASQPGGTIPINVRFEIRNGSGTIVLASGDTGNIMESANAAWNEYGLVFNTGNQTSVILRMINNGVGGCGNDLAIDDIEFKSCGDNTVATDISNNSSLSLCSVETPYALELIATPDFSVYTTHFYQWQESTDRILWNDIMGETNQNITVSVTNTSYYRTKIAEVASNLSNPQCISFSDEFQAIVNPASNMPVIECWENATFNSTSCTWEVSGTQPEQPAVEPWETATFDSTTCTWNISGTESIPITEQNINLCDGSEVILQADTNIEMPSYIWNTGAVTNEIAIEIPGVYTVDITDGVSSFEKIIYNVISIEAPMIASVVSNGNEISVTTVDIGDFLYSLDGDNYQSSSIFSNIEIGLYTIYVKESVCESIVSLEHFHFDIPKFFTPNNDGVNDTFNLLGIQNYSSSQVAIFDRYGKLLVFSSNSPFEWDGRYRNRNLPSGDYWYRIIIDGQNITGNVTLKR